MNTHNLKGLLSFLSVAVMCFVFSSSHAQSFGMEVEGGFTASQIYGDQLVGFNKLGLYVRGQASVPVKDDFYLTTGIGFKQKGSRNGKNESYTVWRLNYVNVPVKLSYRAFEQVTISAGPVFNYLVSASTDAGFGFVDANQYFNKIDLCGELSAAYRFNEQVAGGVSWAYGPLSSSAIPSVTRFHNNTLCFFLRYQFNNK